MNALTIMAVTASCGLAQAAPIPPVCKGGILANAVTGRPMLDAARQPIPCDLPQAQADSDLDPTVLGVGALAAFGAAVGLTVGLRGSSQQTPSFFIPAGQPASP